MSGNPPAAQTTVPVRRILPGWLYRVRNAPVHLLTLVLLGLVRVLPLGWSLAIGEGLGGVAWAVMPRWRRTARRNLELLHQALPAWARPTPEEMDELGRRSALNLGCEVIEFMHMGLAPPDSALRMVVEAQGADHLREALAGGKGAIVIGLHFGNWEVCGGYISRCIAQMNAVGKEQRDSFFTRFAFAWRGRYGIRSIITGKQATSILLRTLKDNGVLGLVSDQNGGKDGLFAPFCGIMASCAPGAAALSLKTGAPLLAVYCERLAPGKLRFVCTPPLDASGLPADSLAARVELQTRVNGLVEGIVRRDPAQWLLGHKRWRTRPPGEPELYW